MTDDDGPDYWQAQAEQERQEQEAADALRSFEQSKRKSGNEHRDPCFRQFGNGKVYEPSEFGPGKDDPDSVHQETASFSGYRVEDSGYAQIGRQRYPD